MKRRIAIAASVRRRWVRASGPRHSGPRGTNTKNIVWNVTFLLDFFFIRREKCTGLYTHREKRTGWATYPGVPILLSPSPSPSPSPFLLSLSSESTWAIWAPPAEHPSLSLSLAPSPSPSLSPSPSPSPSLSLSPEHHKHQSLLIKCFTSINTAKNSAALPSEWTWPSAPRGPNIITIIRESSL